MNTEVDPGPTEDEGIVSVAQLYCNSSESHHASPRACESVVNAIRLMKDAKSALIEAGTALEEDADNRGLGSTTIQGVLLEIAKSIAGLDLTAIYVINSGMAIQPPAAGGPEETARMFAGLNLDRQ